MEQGVIIPIDIPGVVSSFVNVYLIREHDSVERVTSKVYELKTKRMVVKNVNSSLKVWPKSVPMAWHRVNCKIQLRCSQGSRRVILGKYWLI